MHSKWVLQLETTPNLTSSISQEPGEPGERTEPGEPSEPGDPSEPGEPSEPGQLGEPQDPPGGPGSFGPLRDLVALGGGVQYSEWLGLVYPFVFRNSDGVWYYFHGASGPAGRAFYNTSRPSDPWEMF